MMPDAAAVLTYDARGRTDADVLIAAHLPLVRRVAWHVHGRVANAIDVDDLIQTGTIALIEAARAYEDRGHAFATYASVRIRGAMLDSLRRHAAGGRSLIRKRREMEEARTRFHQAHGRLPDDNELASTLSVPVDDLRATAAAGTMRHESIDDLYSDHSMWFADVADLPDEQLSKTQLQAMLAGAIDRLPPREAMVLQLYFVEELNLDEIGAVLGVGAARVCQVKKTALDKLRSMLAEAR